METLTQKFSVFLPVLNETKSLVKTITIIEKDCKNKIYQYLIVVSKKKTNNKSLDIIFNIKNKYKKKIKIIFQKYPYFGGAMKSAINALKSNYFIMMASDLETNPYDVKKLIKKSKIYPNSIIIGSRWQKKKSFKGYNKIKLVCNKLFNFFFSILFKSNVNDLTYGFRIYPSKVIKKIKLKENKHPIMLESILIPIKLNIDIKSIVTNWKSRNEGFSSNGFFANFYYFITGFNIFFKKHRELLK